MGFVLDISREPWSHYDEVSSLGHQRFSDNEAASILDIWRINFNRLLVMLNWMLETLCTVQLLKKFKMKSLESMMSLVSCGQMFGWYMLLNASRGSDAFVCEFIRLEILDCLHQCDGDYPVSCASCYALWRWWLHSNMEMCSMCVLMDMSSVIHLWTS